jgi:AcrR family transcriptional regulator
MSSRRRGEQLETAILDAAWHVMAQVGYARMTMEAVADRAGTSRPVLHRRWDSRAELALATLIHRFPPDADVPDTGSLRSDLLALLGQLLKRFDTVYGETLAGLLAETARDLAAHRALREQINRGAAGARLAAIVDRAVARGELGPVRLPPRVVQLPTDLIRHDVMLYGRPPGDAVVAEIVDDVLIPVLRQLSGSASAKKRG